MARKQRPQRPPKYDTLTSPDASRAETITHHTMAPFDRVAREMDDKWGIDRLPSLVTPDLAEKFGDAMASLNEAIQSGVDLPGWVGVGIRAFAALDAEATANGAKPASQDMIEIEVDGLVYGIMRDDAAWPAIKQARPDVVLVTAREAICAIRNKTGMGVFMESVNTHFPEAKVTAVNQRPPVDYANGGDPIDF